MKTTNKAAILLCAIALSVASQGALADHPCAAEVTAVDNAILSAVFNGKRGEIDRTRMRGKVTEAISKLHQAKYDDAIQKLVDISDKADALATSAKQKLEDDTDIQMSIYYANQCISLL